MMKIIEENKKYLIIIAFVFLIILSVYFVFKSLSEFKNYKIMREQVMNTITLSGHGEVNAIPDIATINIRLFNQAKTVKEAQDEVAIIEKKVLSFLKISGISEKDIKTTNASVYPNYEYQHVERLSPCTQYSCPPISGKNVIIGYEASESITVKIRNTENVGKIMQGLGEFEVSEIGGPNFAIDDEDALKAKARKEAINDAKSKAKILARDLGVHLGDIVAFDENGNYPIYSMYEKTAMMAEGGNGSSASAEIPAGENTISSDVSITFQIR